MIEVVSDLRFGIEGNAARSQVRGFSHPEDGFTWSIDAEAALLVDLSEGAPPTLIEIDISPLALSGVPPRQRLELRINGVKIAADPIERAGTIGYWIPKTIPLRSRCLIELVQPDAIRPSDFGGSDDTRRLGFMFRRLRLLNAPRNPPFVARRLPPMSEALGASAARPEIEREITRRCGLSLHDLMFEFESLGWNCEFGILQRACGAEPLSLLRFSGIALPDLLNALADGFSGIDDPGRTRLELVGAPPREFLFRNDAYGMSAHTWRHEDKTETTKVLEDVLRNLRFYRRKFHEDLESGGHLYVFQRSGQLLPAQALPLLTALRRHGDCSLLFVSETSEIPSGAVEQLSPNLFQGFIKQLAPGENVALSDLESWLSICTNAWSLWKGLEPDQNPA